MAAYEVFASNAGVGTAGLVLAWESLVQRDGGGAEDSPPAFTDLGGGWYTFSYSPSETMLGVIDLDSDAAVGLSDADRYVPCKFTADDAAPQINLVKIDGLATNGNNATLNLKKLNIVNDSGDAIVASSTGSNGSGLKASGNGSGSGVEGTGGDTGHGLKAKGGSSSGQGIQAEADGEGYGIQGYGRGDSKPGIRAEALEGPGMVSVGAANHPGINAIGNGTASGIKSEAGGTGHGIEARGGSTSGDGIHAEAITAGDGIEAVGAGGGYDINGDINGDISTVGGIVPDEAGTAAGLHSTTDDLLTTIAGYVDTEVGAIKVVTDKLETMVEIDGAVYRLTSNALEQVPSAGISTTDTVDGSVTYATLFKTMLSIFNGTAVVDLVAGTITYKDQSGNALYTHTISTTGRTVA